MGDRLKFLLRKETRLLNEARGCVGMLQEVVYRSKLLTLKVKAEKKQKKLDGEPLNPSSEIRKSARRIQSDLDRYRSRLDEILGDLAGIHYELDQISGLDSGEGIKPSHT